MRATPPPKTISNPERIVELEAIDNNTRKNLDVVFRQRKKSNVSSGRQVACPGLSSAMSHRRKHGSLNAFTSGGGAIPQLEKEEGGRHKFLLNIAAGRPVSVPLHSTPRHAAHGGRVEEWIP